MSKMTIALVGILLLPALAPGQEVDLHQAVSEAAEQRPFARAARARSQAAEAAADEARGRYLPQLTLEEGYRRTSQPGNGLFIALNQEDFTLQPSEELYTTRENFATRLTLRQPLFNSDIYFGQRRARDHARAAQAEASWGAEKAAFAAFRAYLDVQRARAARDAAQSSRAEAAEVLRMARVHHEAGVGMKADVLRAGVALSEAENRLLTVENDLTLARRRLALAMGRPGDEVEIAAALKPASFAGEIDSLALRRGDLEALAYRTAAMREARRQAKAAYLPKLGADAVYEMHDPDTPFGDQGQHWSVNLGLSWTLFDGLQREKRRNRAEAEYLAARQEHLEALRSTRLQVEEAVLRAAEAEAHLTTARRAVAEATESHRLLRERYAAGLSDLSDLLAVRAALDRARVQAVSAESRLILALGNIRFQKGVFLQTLLADKESVRE
nr:TolC family protein [Desulfuromonadales bacterium]